VSFHSQINRQRLQMCFPQQPIDLFKLIAELFKIFVRPHGNQVWTQPALKHYVFFDGSLICHRNQIMELVFRPEPGKTPGFGRYLFT
jgi:hypothetical protein